MVEPKGGAIDTPVIEHPLAAAVVRAFRTRLDLSNVVIREWLAGSAPFVELDQDSGQIVVGKTTLIKGLVATGGRHIKDRPDSPAAWLVEWLSERQMTTVLKLLGESEVDEASRRGYKVVPTEIVRRTVLPRARKLAKLTRFDGQISFKHLVLALVDDPNDWMDILTRPFGPSEFADLKDHLVRRTLADVGSNDNLDGWDSLARSSSAHLKAEQSAPTMRDSLPTLADLPATIDRLGREYFAKSLARRLQQASGEQAAPDGAGAFMVHIHGPWGHGKTSVLNFLRSELEGAPRPWLVVTFDAWKHHRLATPWWHLIKTVYADALRTSGRAKGLKLRLLWWSWRLRGDWLPILLVAAILGLVAAGLVEKLGSGETALKILTALLTAAAGVYAYIRFLLFGSANAADTYLELKVDPYRPVVKLYGHLIQAIGQPVAIFIDDLDRCGSDYVTQLIEGVQTLLRAESVTYVVAADRKWICAAFEKKYADFTSTIGEPTRPLGYLFLDKLFQISAPLPGLSPGSRNSFWRELLNGDLPPEIADDAVKTATVKIEGKDSVEALRDAIAKAPEQDKAALRAAAALKITSAQSAKAIEHSLQSIRDLLEPNPRAMKRLVNAVGMAQARVFLEARDVPLDIVARWTLIELRWPLLADHLREEPSTIDRVGEEGDALAKAELPPPIASMMNARALEEVVRPKGMAQLDSKALEQLLF